MVPWLIPPGSRANERVIGGGGAVFFTGEKEGEPETHCFPAEGNWLNSKIKKCPPCSKPYSKR